ncbi:MAG: HD domain-containing phosphohydrolase [Thermodesulfobacteriota bacterium]
MRVLVAEDNRFFRLLVEASLKKWGHEVVGCEDGSQAWELLVQEDPPRVALLDWEMPKLEGVEICRRLRALKNRPYRGDLETLRRLALAAECKDDETGAHMVRTGALSALLAEKLGLGEQFTSNMFHAAPTHDLGKIGIPDGILLKRGPLTQVEVDIMKRHTLIGAKILDGSAATVFRLARTIALTHHERWDGNGYPSGLARTEIPLAGRIVALIDAFDAMTSNRPYRRALTVERTCKIIREESAKQFDPHLVNVFLTHVNVFLEMRERMNKELPASAHCPPCLCDVLDAKSSAQGSSMTEPASFLAGEK